jgi:hypothetical protein
MAQPTVTWVPPDPTAEDVVLLHFSDSWYNGCVPRLAAVHRDPDPADFPALYPEVDVPLPIAARWAVVLESLAGDCTSAFSPYTVDVALAHLPAGHNRVAFLVRDHFYEPPEDLVLEIVDIAVGGPTDTLALHGGRFRVTASWRDFDGHTGQGLLVPGHGTTSGLFTFFGQDNWELLVKVLDGCAVNGRFWVFLAAATNVEYTVRVEDLVGEEKLWVHTNPLGELSRAIADTDAFGVCALP